MPYKTYCTLACALLGCSAMLSTWSPDALRADSQGAASAPALACNPALRIRPPLPSQNGKKVTIGKTGPVLVVTSTVGKAIDVKDLVRPEDADFVLYGPIGKGRDDSKPTLKMPMRFADEKELQKFLEGGDARLKLVGEAPKGYSVATFEKSFVLVECRLKIKLRVDDETTVERPIPLPIDTSDKDEVPRTHTPYLRATLGG